MLHEIIISNSVELIRVSALDVLAIKASGNYSIVVLTDGSEQLITLQLGQVEQLVREQLGGTASVFVRVGRSVIINMEYLFSIHLTKKLMTLRSESGTRVAFEVSRDALEKLKMYAETKFEN